MKKHSVFVVLSLILLIGACGKEKEVYEEEEIVANLAEINIVLDNDEVLAGKVIRFDITGKADFLTFFSGELGKEYYENSFGGDEYEGRLDYLEYIYDEAGDYEAFFLLKDKRENERVIGPFNITVEAIPEPEPEPEAELVVGTLFGNIGNPNFAFDLAGMVSYAPGTGANPGNAHEVPDQIDLVMLWLGNAPSFSLPTGVGNASSSGVFTLTTKHDGVLFRLEAPTEEEIARFEALERKGDLIEAYELEEGLLMDREGYVATSYDNLGVDNHGPLTGGLWTSNTTARMRGANVGDILYFKSLGRDLYAAFRVKSMDLATTPRTIEFEVKSILED